MQREISTAESAELYGRTSKLRYGRLKHVIISRKRRFECQMSLYGKEKKEKYVKQREGESKEMCTEKFPLQR